MMNLLKFMPPVYHKFFLDLPTAPVEDEVGPLPYMQEEEAGEETTQNEESS